MRKSVKTSEGFCFCEDTKGEMVNLSQHVYPSKLPGDHGIPSRF